MKLSIEKKREIQFFVYYLFNGGLTPKLKEFNYLHWLLSNPKALYNCFVVFATACENNNPNPNSEVENFIINLDKTSFNTTVVDNLDISDFWRDFLELARCFCFNDFPIPILDEYIQGLEGCGTDAVPIFAVWTNVLEIDEKSKPTNSKYALIRANERIKLWDEIGTSTKFEDHELEQEIY
ncbi:MAG: hypothetical protein RL264_197 [Bacteroidota bacterium]|jgi:hypothetical protein